MKKYWPIVNCTFAFECNEDFEKMQKTPYANIRFCSKCEKQVFLCRNDKQADWVAKNGFCGAIRIKETDFVLGMMLSE